MSGELVCVTGASGFIGAHVVRALLDGGYRVRATVRDPNNEKKVAHLKKLNGSDRLTLVKADLLDQGSFDDAVAGCDGVFHTASPFIFAAKDKENGTDLLNPAVDGTLNVFSAIEKASSVKKVVLTSSIAAVAYNGGKLPKDHVYTSADWSDADLLRSQKSWYQLSKTLAERAAWDQIDKLKASGRVIDLWVICPTFVIGPMLQQTLNTSSELVLSFLNGTKKTIQNQTFGFVDVRDVASAHVLAYEKTPEEKRFLSIVASVPMEEWCAQLRKIVPNSKTPTKVDDGEPPSRMLFDNSPLIKIGWNPVSFEDALRATVDTLKQFGHYKE